MLRTKPPEEEPPSKRGAVIDPSRISPVGVRVRRKPPIPKNNDDTVNWSALFPEIITKRPEGMDMETYRVIRKYQQKMTKIARR